MTKDSIHIFSMKKSSIHICIIIKMITKLNRKAVKPYLDSF